MEGDSSFLSRYIAFLTAVYNKLPSQVMRWCNYRKSCPNSYSTRAENKHQK